MVTDDAANMLTAFITGMLAIDLNDDQAKYNDDSGADDDIYESAASTRVHSFSLTVMQLSTMKQMQTKRISLAAMKQKRCISCWHTLVVLRHVRNCLSIIIIIIIIAYVQNTISKLCSTQN